MYCNFTKLSFSSHYVVMFFSLSRMSLISQKIHYRSQFHYHGWSISLSFTILLSELVHCNSFHSHFVRKFRSPSHFSLPVIHSPSRFSLSLVFFLQCYVISSIVFKLASGRRKRISGETFLNVMC